MKSLARIAAARCGLSRVQLVFLSVLAAVGCLTLAANAQTVSGNGTGTNNGFYYQLYSSGGSATMTLGSAGNYAVNWSGVGDVVAGKGWNPGSKTRVVGYNVGSASGYNNIAVYAWFTNPLVETYIGEFGSVVAGNLMGSVTSDGHTYSTYEHQQVNQPSIEGTTTFEQYLDNWGGQSIGTNGTVTTANHYNHWQSIGLTVGTPNLQIFEVEAYNGASGSANATVWDATSSGGGSTPSFNLVPSSSSVSVTQGSSTTDTIELQDVDGFTGSVELSASDLPNGVSASFATNPTTSNSTLTLTAGSSAASGSSDVTITGVSGSITKTATIALTVNSPSSGGGGGSGTGGCTVDYTISQYNSTQFGATIGIKNGGSTALSGWTLTWSFANGQTISSSWNGAVSQSGANVTVSEQSGQTWENIPAGGTYSGFGFNGSSTGTNAIPTSFKLNGTACTVN